MNSKYIIKSILAVLAISLPFASMAQGVMETSWVSDKVLLYALYFIIAMLLFFVLVLYRIMNHMRNYLNGAFDKEEDTSNQFSGIERFLQLKPLSSDKDTVIANHDYDGIQELDNPPPPWFMFLFYGTVLFAVIYISGYLITKNWPSQMEEYETEMAIAEEAKKASLEAAGNAIDESNVVASTDAADIAAGKAIFIGKCEVCHLAGGIGQTGPNLTDDFWIHGGSDADIFKVIKYGVVEKGMVAWKDQLLPKMMQDVVSYIQSLEYVGPENGGKAPEGEKYEKVKTQAPTTDTQIEATDSTVNGDAGA
jgi:cytochrome c oxidase cbb3-type subunit 3